MKFAIVVRKKQSLFRDRDFRKVTMSLASILFVSILSVIHMIIPGLGGVVVIIGILGGAAYLFYINNIFSDTDYYHVLGDIDFDEDVVKINDEEIEYEEIGYDKMQQIKVFIGFFKNYTRESYIYNKVWMGSAGSNFMLEKNNINIHSSLIQKKNISDSKYC